MNDSLSTTSGLSNAGREMLHELSNMDRITQLQDEIQFLLTIMSRSLQYLTSRTTFLQISDAIPVTKQRNTERYDPADVFEANQRELVEDLITKAKQVEYLINSLPVPEPEKEQADRLHFLEIQMDDANEEYRQALGRAKRLHAHISEVLETMLTSKQDETSSSMS